MISLRPIRDEDQPLLERIYASTREDVHQLDWNQQQKEAFIAQQHKAQHTYYQQHFANAHFDLILEEGEPIGRLYVDRRADEIRIIDIALLPEHRQRGIGSKLMRELLDEAAAHHLPVRIHVERYNPAFQLYQRLGFRKVGETGVYFLMEWKAEAKTDKEK